MPIIIAFIIAAVIIVSKTAKNKKRQEEIKRAAEAAQRKKAAASAPAEGQPSRPQPHPQESDIERRLRQEELKRRLQANAERRAAEQQYAERRQAAGMPPAPAPAPAPARKPLEKNELRRDMSRADKPVVVHNDDDCTGGSIHDGYHEGVSTFSPKDTPRPIAVAGALGHRLTDEDERLEREAAAAENARRALERISKLPPLAQGMVYAEILGRPKSDTAA